MPQREFEITIGPEGSLEVHLKGFKGRSCLEVMKLFEQLVAEFKNRQPLDPFSRADEEPGETEDPSGRSLAPPQSSVRGPIP